MSLFDFAKKQFIDVLEWQESSDGILAYRYPMRDNEIQNGAQLTVRDSQMALFVNEGQIADVFAPGLHKLSTHTLPVLTNLKNWDKLFASPFKSDLYFFSTREQLDLGWGTAQPVTIRDKDFGVVRIRAHGKYSFRLSDPRAFYQTVSGTREKYTREELEGQLRSLVLTEMASLLGQSAVPFIDMSANQTLFSKTLQNGMTPAFARYGLKLESFYVQSLSLPEELQAYLDKASSMRMLGDMKQYAQFQAAESLPIAAANEGGLAGVGAGLGAGVALGQTMASAFAPPANQVPTTPAPEAAKEDPFALIEKLHGLLTKGILTQAEFDAKKAEIMKKI